LETALLPWSFEDEITSKGTALRSNNGFARSNTAAIAPADDSDVIILLQLNLPLFPRVVSSATSEVAWW